MKLLIKFPTRNRPNKFFKALDTYLNFLDDPTTQIIVTCDNNDSTMTESYVKEVVEQYNNVKMYYGDSKTKIEAINADLKDVDFDILLLASDDMIPKVKGYDTVIKNKMKEHYPDTDGVLWFNDGHKGNDLNTLCILGKKYYDRFGYIYYPEYISVWCDNEFMDVANLLGKQTYFDQVIIEHQHPDWGYGQEDVIHSINRQHEAKDKQLYNTRKLNQFR